MQALPNKRLERGTSAFEALLNDFLRAWGVVLSMRRLYVPSVLLGLVVSNATVRLMALLGEQTSVIAANEFLSLLERPWLAY